MIRTLFFFTVFWIILFITLPLILPVYIFQFLNLPQTKKKYVRNITSFWARFTLLTAGIRVRKAGFENIPLKNSGFVVVSNHQGTFDIPVFVSILPFSPGFIAKEELNRLPFLSSWMKALDCLTINRKNPRAAWEKIGNWIKLEGKNPMVLFPEGTRSRGKQAGNFRTGSLKLIFQHKLDILPVSVMGTYRGFEEKGAIRPAEVNVTFHPLIRTSAYHPEDFIKFLEHLKSVIHSGLTGD